MSRHVLPTRVPCGVCAARILHWYSVNGEPVTDCGHSMRQIGEVGRTMVPVKVGEYEGNEIPWIQ